MEDTDPILLDLAREIPRELSNNELLKRLERHYKTKYGIQVNAVKKNGEYVLIETGVNGSLFIVFQFLSKGSYDFQSGGYFLLKCWDFNGVYDGYPSHLRELVQFWSYITFYEYENLIAHKGKNDSSIFGGGMPMIPYEKFKLNAPRVSYYSIQDFDKTIELLFNYVELMVKRHRERPLFPMKDI